MSKNEIMVINGKEVPATLVHDVQAVIDRFKASVNNSKAIAETCYKLRSNPEFGKTFAPEVEPGQDCKKAFVNVVQALADKAGINLTGASAYKYAQVYELYHTTDIWKYWNIGKMIITSRLESNKAKTGRSTAHFVVWLGIIDNNQRKDKMADWEKTNAEQLKKIDALNGMGFDTAEEKKRLTEKPSPAPYIPTGDDEEDIDYYYTTGMSIVVNFTDKQLKQAVAEYIDNNLTDEEKAKIDSKQAGDKESKGNAESKGEEKAEPSLLDEAIASLTAYTSSLDTVPTELTKALLTLKATRGE